MLILFFSDNQFSFKYMIDIMIAPQKVVKRLFPAGFTAGSCSLLQPGAITIWLSNLRKKVDEI